MPTWLICYRKRTGDLERFEEFADPQEALRERFRAEKAQPRRRGYEDPGLEIVTITAASLEILRKHHGRYFAKGDAAMAELARLGQEIEASPPGIVTSGEGSNNPARG